MCFSREYTHQTFILEQQVGAVVLLFYWVCSECSDTNNVMLFHINVLLELSYAQKSSSTKPFIGCKLNICLLNVAIAKILPLVGSLELGLCDLRNKAMNCLIETLAKEKAFRRKCKIIFIVALVQWTMMKFQKWVKAIWVVFWYNPISILKH